jgi:hypothetical protein
VLPSASRSLFCSRLDRSKEWGGCARPWANERDSVDKLAMGSMAKYTLASNAARHAELLALLKRDASSLAQPRVPR